MDEREKKLRAKRANLASEARSILEAGPADAALSAEDQKRYDDLMDEFDAIGSTLEAGERAKRAAADLEAPVGGEPTRPDPTDAGDGTRKVRANATPEYREAFKRYLATGVEGRALQMDSDTAGGFAVAPQEFSDTLIKAVDNQVFVRRMTKNKYRVPNAASLGVPTLAADPDDADWTSELATGGEDSAMQFGKREFRPNPLAKLIKVSNKLIRAMGTLAEFSADGSAGAMGVDGLVNDRLAYKQGVAQEKGFMTGSGVRQPLGVFTASSDGISTGRDVVGANTTTAIAADGLIDAKYSLKPQYLQQPSTAWAFHRDAVKAIRKLKDSNGQYVWAPGAIGIASLAGDKPDQILDLPFFMSEYVPNTFTAGLYVGILGAWDFYWIADALDVTVQRLVELYAATNQVGYIGRTETDGMPVLEEAFARVTLHS